MYDKESLNLAYSLVHILDVAIPCEVANNLTVMPDYGAIKIADMLGDMKHGVKHEYITH